MKGIHCFISGQVQGVSFRAYTQDYANGCQLTGWVRNLLDGRVELQAFGDNPQVDALISWLKSGDTPGRVESMNVVDIPVEAWDGFAIRSTQ